MTALAIDSAQALDPARYAIGSLAPRAAVRPTSRAELVETLRAAARDRLAVVPWGGAVSLPRERAPERYDLAIDLTGLDAIVEYQPDDLTLTAECGVTIASLRERLAARGQELPLEAAHASRATLGGVLAANASGARRLRFGAPRDRILGARFALGDGTIARTGGKVVKNVAGYGIHRLLCGSRGGLVIILEASLKLMPAPATRVALVYEVGPREIADASRWSRFPRLEPAVLTVVSAAEAGAVFPTTRPGSGSMVVVGFEDDAARVIELESLAAAALGAPQARLEGAEAVALWQSLADLEERDGARLSFASAHNTPAWLATVLERDRTVRFVFHPPAGRLHLFPDSQVAATWIERLAEAGFALIGARGAGEVVPALAPMAATLALRGRIREALDPGRALALGHRWERGAL